MQGTWGGPGFLRDVFGLAWGFIGLLVFVRSDTALARVNPRAPPVVSGCSVLHELLCREELVGEIELAVLTHRN